MRRREFMGLIGGVAAYPLAAGADQPTMPVIGSLYPGSPEAFAGITKDAFFRGLAEAGYLEGKNVKIEYRFANGRYDQLPALAKELAERNVTIIVTTGGEPAALAAKAATSKIPIIFGIGGDPIKAGLVDSLSRPGGNATGISLLTPGMEPIRLQLLHETVPTAKLLAALVNPNHPLAETQTNELLLAANTLGIELLILPTSSAQQIEVAFATLTQRQAGGLVVTFDPFFIDERDHLIALAARFGVPAVYGYRDFAKAGGLMSYGSSPADAVDMIGRYAGRVLAGAKISDLPVWQAVKVELFLNLKTAKALGLTIPLALLGRADEVIE
jgi:putative tryptophan/tyrosine transport system substrate-binding protein